MYRSPRFPHNSRGAALIALLALLLVGVLAFATTMFGPGAIDAYRNHKTEAALMEAREALLGYAAQYRDTADPDSVYGYLPLPDLGTSRNNNAAPSCHVNNDPSLAPLEGCDAAHFSGVAFDPNGVGPTVIGRFPWRSLGTEPIRDGHGECLWLIISSPYGRISRSFPPPNLPIMNWDTFGQLDLVVANGTANLTSILTSLHERPVAIIFSAGSPLPNQHRDTSATDDVSQCGGNYDVANYLDPDAAGALGVVTNYFASSTNNASGYTRDETRTEPLGTDDNTKSVSSQGAIQRRDDNTLWPSACATGDNCALASNDRGLALTPDTLFGVLRRSAGFRTDINSMLDRIVGCLRDTIAAGSSFTPQAIDGYSSPSDKSAGRIPNNSCYDDTKAPLNYFGHWQDMIFVARPASGYFTVSTTLDGATYTTNNSCAGVLVFSDQRGTKTPAPTDPQEPPVQLRTMDAVSVSNTAQNTNWLPNYLEDESLAEPTNLAHFTGTGTSFKGAEVFEIVSSTQSANRDIVRCIPNTGSMETTSPQDLVDDDGNPLSPLANYDPGTRTLTLGSPNAIRDNGVAVDRLYGCAWTPEVNSRGNGFRAYFSFRFMGITGGLGNNGFVFAAIDGQNNTTSVCGAAGSHLGYSGDNGVTPPLTFPKIGIEFDRQRNSGFSESTDLATTNPGRFDPTGGEHDYHSAIVYWGHEQANGTVTRPLDDDNVHGYPTTGSQGTNPRPAPQNPDTSSAGVAFVDYRANGDSNGDGQSDSWLYHVRVEVTPTRNINNSAAELSNTSFITRVWIDHGNDTDPLIIAMKNTTRSMAQLYPGATPTLSDMAVVYDVQGAECIDGACSASGYTCGSDNYCYRPGLKFIRLGFTNSQRTQDQRVIINDFFTSWLP